MGMRREGLKNDENLRYDTSQYSLEDNIIRILKNQSSTADLHTNGKPGIINLITPDVDTKVNTGKKDKYLKNE